MAVTAAEARATAWAREVADTAAAKLEAAERVAPEEVTSAVGKQVADFDMFQHGTKRNTRNRKRCSYS